MERCPRCGTPDAAESPRRRQGLLLRPALPRGGKRKRCYVGPRVYRHVEKLHGIGLAGMVDEERWARYLERAVDRAREELAGSQEGVESSGAPCSGPGRG
jgi:hypothetical protein